MIQKNSDIMQNKNLNKIHPININNEIEANQSNIGFIPSNSLNLIYKKNKRIKRCKDKNSENL